MQPYIPEYTSYFKGAPPRRHWPLLMLIPVGATAIIAAVAFIVMVAGMAFM
ncbi:MAG: hypothetical protein OEW37_08030 [Rhodospirillaceae bacterium]|nr:hypothetical protein [Rhodospirillaceae bacterium]